MVRGADTGRKIAAVVVVSAFFGCTNTFDPVAPFSPRMIVYSVLSSDTDTQFVRIYTSYRSASGDSDEHQVTDAAVTVSSGASVISLRDTTVNRPDKSRYPSNIHLYYSPDLPITKGTRYTLHVVSPSYGTVVATTQTPQSGRVSLSQNSEFYIIDPWVSIRDNGRFPDDNIAGTTILGNLAKGYIVRMVVYYESLDSTTNVWTYGSAEIPPNTVKNPPGSSELYTYYPALVKSKQQQNNFQINTYSYQVAIYNINYKFSLSAFIYNVSYTRAVFYLYQYDVPFMDYYGSANEFSDTHSIRVDQIDYSNIPGGAGVFATSVVDSIVVPLPGPMAPPPMAPPWKP